MSHTYTNLLYHVIFSTKERRPFINDELKLHTLRYSKHPCAALFNGTLSSGYQSTDDFPFAAFAGDAFETDVSAKVKELLSDGFVVARAPIGRKALQLVAHIANSKESSLRGDGIETARL